MDARMEDQTKSAFGLTYVHEPQAEHTHTIILLHGRGSSGEEFAEELFEGRLSDQSKILPCKFPSCKWVFPSSPEVWNPVFQEDISAWFQAHSLTDVDARQDLQIPGIKQSVEYILTLLSQEIDALDGRAESVFLGGISLGGAVGLWALLCLWNAPVPRRIGGFFAVSTWLPFSKNISRVLNKVKNSGPELPSDGSESDTFVETMLSPAIAKEQNSSFLSIPIFLGHGSDDAYVNVNLGRQARDLLLKVGFQVEWKEYSGAEQEGHWLKCPEEMDDIASFLSQNIIK
ncbi:unnamed protein product [Clonostachys byssicola]|uniref:Phospholipase/carboxylesterase/thioesterase domain-containing protein n=1 Tax=Clonostachys byssicola TaxID=160290 RepID=A0A9N9UFI4_9HYPO|nr:unnamed protein product [Clonostachys byssicola]